MQSGADVSELVLRCHQFEKKAANSLGLTVEETHCLSQLYLHAPSRVSRLTELLGVSPTRMSRLLLTLERRGLISRRQSRTDGRVEQISLTENGMEVVTRLLAMSSESRWEILQDLAPMAVTPGARRTDRRLNDY